MEHFFNDDVKRIDVTDKTAAIKNVKSLTKKAGAFRVNLHVVLVATLDHAVLYRDCSPLSTLYNELPTGIHKTLIKSYVEGTTSFKYGKNKAGEAMFLGRGKKDEKVYEVSEEMLLTPFYDFQKEASEKKEYSFKEEYLRLMAKADKKLAAGEFPAHDLPLLEGLKASAFPIINPEIQLPVAELGLPEAEMVVRIAA